MSRRLSLGVLFDLLNRELCCPIAVYTSSQSVISQRFLLIYSRTMHDSYFVSGEGLFVVVSTGHNLALEETHNMSILRICRNIYSATLTEYR